MNTPLRDDVRTLAANTIRALAIDATNAANSGHPGAPMGLADVAVVLWADVMRYDPTAPSWPNRDRFVLSNGHASMLVYSALHLAGYELSLDDLRNFRQLGSRTPGHPEYGLTPGIETTTGPLGQGFATAVGMALAARMMKARFPADAGFLPVAHHVFGIFGDGCVMEGITSEAASLAGHLGLGELVLVFDDNGITIDGKTDIASSDDIAKRFESYGWHTLAADGHDQDAMRRALEAGKAETARPTIILAKTHIGFGSPSRQDTAKAHGEPLGKEEAERAKRSLGWQGEAFEVPMAVRTLFHGAKERGREARLSWERDLRAWLEKDAARAASWSMHFALEVPNEAHDAAHEIAAKSSGATRAISGAVLNAIAKSIPALVGGSADLAGSNNCTLEGSPFLEKASFVGRNIHFGIREHAMAAIGNGLALYGTFIPFGATFLVFSDYMRPALRLAALMKIRTIQIFTHDSIGLGEDGPTHQPIEHLWSLRLIPNLTVWRPADALETAVAWLCAAGEGNPSPHALVLTRQKVPNLAREAGFDRQTIAKGGYVLVDRPGANLVILATGSEVSIAVDAAALLEADGIRARVVSMPSVERFLATDRSYRESVLPPELPKVSIEAGRTSPWAMLTGSSGLNLGIDRFGESAPASALYEHFGLTPGAIRGAIVRFWREREAHCG